MARSRTTLIPTISTSSSPTLRWGPWKLASVITGTGRPSAVAKEAAAGRPPGPRPCPTSHRRRRRRCWAPGRRARQLTPTSRPTGSGPPPRLPSRSGLPRPRARRRTRRRRQWAAMTSRGWSASRARMDKSPSSTWRANASSHPPASCARRVQQQIYRWATLHTRWRLGSCPTRTLAMGASSAGVTGATKARCKPSDSRAQAA
mmetsp:Transcript_132369/g.423593  ORF Transcript_132369/g.423593 Transcript_132369/m.423593 type:complete len:203 (-) Transcript_132369:1166-1774(-)